MRRLFLELFIHTDDSVIIYISRVNIITVFSVTFNLLVHKFNTTVC